jgi:hypothetical protein
MAVIAEEERRMISERGSGTAQRIKAELAARAS